MNISNAFGKWEKKFLEGCVWRLESQNKNFSFIIMGVVGVFQRGGGGGVGVCEGGGGGGGTYHSHPTSMLHYPVFFLVDDSSA